MSEASGTQPAQAERLLTELLSALQAYSNADPHIPLTFENLIRVYLSTGRYEEAVQAGERYRQVVREQNPQPPVLARSCNNLGVAYRRFGKFELSRSSFSESLEHARQAGTAAASRFEALVRFNRGLLESDEQRWDEAEEDFRSSFRLHEKQFGPNHANLGDLLNNIGVLAYNRGRYEEAAAHFRRALEVWEMTLGSLHPKNAIARCNLAALFRLLGFFGEAEWWFQ